MKTTALAASIVLVPITAAAQTLPPGTPIPTTTPFVQPTLPAGIRPYIIINPRDYMSPTPRPRATPRRHVARPTPWPTRDPQAFASPEVFERTSTGTPPPR